MSLVPRGFGIGLATVAVLACGLGIGAGQAAAWQPKQAGPSLRVIGGERVQPGHSPWMVALVDRRATDRRESVFCGGSLIGRDWVITAAHCVRGLGPARIEVLPGIDSLKSSRSGAIGLRGIRSLSRLGLDVALLHLKRGSRMRPLAISNELPESGELATALGWGSTTVQGKGVDRLRQVELEIRSQADCRAAYFGAFDPETMVCAGSLGRDTCFGDSGGPLVSEGQLIGITSFGRGCGYWPGVYVRADRLLPRVRAVITRDTLSHRRAKLLAGTRR